MAFEDLTGILAKYRLLLRILKAPTSRLQPKPFMNLLGRTWESSLNCKQQHWARRRQSNICKLALEDLTGILAKYRLLLRILKAPTSRLQTQALYELIGITWGHREVQPHQTTSLGITTIHTTQICITSHHSDPSASLGIIQHQSVSFHITPYHSTSLRIIPHHIVSFRSLHNTPYHSS